MEKTRRYGSGRVFYWAHVAGPTERRGSVRSADTAFELMPLATRKDPYGNVLLVDLATHPRIIPAETLVNMLPVGVYMTDLARQSMPGLEESSIFEIQMSNGERGWCITDTTIAFGHYWKDEDRLDLSTEALQNQHRRIRALAEGRGDLPLNVFPIPYTTIISMRNRCMVTLADLMALDLHGVQLQSDLEVVEIAEAYRIIQSTLEARRIETRPSGVVKAA